jgi:hypothetical protein
MRTILAILAALAIAAHARAETEALVTDESNNVISGRDGVLLFTNRVKLDDGSGDGWTFNGADILSADGWIMTTGPSGIGFVGSLEFGGTNPAFYAATTRTNLGIPLAALTNTNNVNFRSAIELGTTNAVAFGSLTLSYKATTTNYTVAVSDHFVNVTSNTVTITLPTAVGVAGKIYRVKNSGTGATTIATTSSQTIDGTTNSPVISQNESITIISDGANWTIN